ncbi:uncharacterized protein LOC125051610 [Pieris napi]|uniref:uncharacterized protein LOC125051610 n=1 Tax=Pieris napi TaxID=78633 RepID=UPI001FBA136D|nr:uncharacterized protein LOC125051610 [Pieris napi]
MSATLQTSLKEKICESVEIPILTRCCFCFPLRKGLITFAYFNTILSILDVAILSYIASNRSTNLTDESEYPRLIVDTSSLVLEIVMSVMFIVALHMKHVLLMKVFLYFEIVFSTVSFIYSLVFLGEETASELFLILFLLTLQVYLVILIWSSIVKMERDDSVKYTRERDNV